MNKGGKIMEEKFGKIIVDGKVINLDTIPEEELEKMIEKLEKREEEIRKEIDELMEEDLNE